jgi:site-specific DNA recombinase
MKTADLYIRVSTDEQADKGYSQRDQEERLTRYCEHHNITIRKVVFEDYSAKNFNRPEWTKLLADLRKSGKQKPGLILFTKWDRFSRNTADAYQMISTLRKLEIEPQAIDQPLDHSIPESKTILAVYLSMPEVENDRRALNVFYGMRRAKKEGRWMATAPVGYCNKSTEEGRKYIAPKEPAASVMKWAFQELAKGVLAADQIRKEANKRGIKCSRSNFWNAIRNPVYCGKIRIPKFKDEETYLVNGQHEPIISEALFYEVQDILDGKKRKERPNTKISSNENLPLRGFLTCPKCNSMLTGSASKGQYYTYYYYHCKSPCSCRFRADLVNEGFVKELGKLVPHPGVAEIYQNVVAVAYEKENSQNRSANRQAAEEIGKLNEKLGKARELLLTGDLDPADYRTIKTDYEKKIIRLEAQLSDLSVTGDFADIDKLLNKVVSLVSHIDELYVGGDIVRKRQIISSIYPEKLTFDGKNYRTFRMNRAAELMYQINNELDQRKNRKGNDFSYLSGWVAPTGIEPVSGV